MMTDAKAKMQHEIEVATGPTSAIAQLLNARMLDLEVIVLAQAAKIEHLEARLDRTSRDLQKRIYEEIRRSTRSGLL